ncbi:AFR127Wp [Eremothecium gossypii ATCC 10895]|uniref:AFR127Wp n=1 Tax=Eremothecium gossypii (strain ATCC 10895 / CBS 109.51 / FGSC 9923 / NRRL Y-1056) TaxID=284811 RepID=Q754E3_EREGS|nr:AFR127Wp [Eremothecium gossypii ATCC 10895]AAS53498.2 AFR127Wp [Eremothecium gossypii ATCC 10895]AEY97810.1 FAFR127Wp [Eremothecium gossypii FDAG1]
MFLQLLAVLGTIFGFLFLTLSIAAGLYYVSELVEEYSEPTRRFLNRTIYAVIATYALLLVFDSFPFFLTCFSIASHVVYAQNLRKFPFISLSSPTFVASCVLVALNHYLWLRHFNNNDVPVRFRMDPGYRAPRRTSLAEVTSFFALCVWFIPFALFVSLSAGDNVLPTAMGKKDDDARDAVTRKASSLLKVLIDSVRSYFHSVARVFGIRASRHNDGLAL